MEARIFGGIQEEWSSVCDRDANPRPRDYSVCTVWAETDTGFYLLDVWRGRVEYPELKRQAVALDAKWNPELVLIEDKASGQSLIQELRRDTKMPLRAIKVDRDKKSRAHAVTGLNRGWPGLSARESALGCGFSRRSLRV